MNALRIVYCVVAVGVLATMLVLFGYLSVAALLWLGLYALDALRRAW